MATDQPESATGKPPETAFRRLLRQWHIAAMGLLLVATGILAPLVALFTGWPCKVFLLPLALLVALIPMCFTDILFSGKNPRGFPDVADAHHGGACGLNWLWSLCDWKTADRGQI
jgi:hypothetical protein